MKLSDSQYRAMSDLFNECPAAFQSLPLVWKTAFFDRLYSKD
jgi:hypothetical protein